MRLSPLWIVVVVIAAPLGLSQPASGQTSNQPATGIATPSLTQETPASSEAGAELPRPDESKMVVVETFPAKPKPAAPTEVLVQTPASQNPSGANESTPNPDGTNESTPTPTPEPSPVEIIPPAGTEGAPQQETPDQIQIPIDPGNAPTEEDINVPPSVQPSPPPAPEVQPSPAPNLSDAQVLVAELVVRSAQGQLSDELQNQVRQAIRTQAGRTTTRSGLQEDINAVFATGFFSDVRVEPEDTPLGVRVTFIVQPNPILRNVQVQANVGTNIPSVLPQKVVEDIFQQQYGRILNLRDLQDGVKRLNQWYQQNGYVLAQVIDAPAVAADGTVTLQVAEGVVEDIRINFRNKEGEETDDKGRPIRGRTRPFIITRELELKPRQVFNRNTVQRDLQRVYGLGLFEDVQVSLNPGQDPRQVVVVLNVNERSSGSVAAGAGISSASGLFGTLSYQQQNLGGNNQKLGAEIQAGVRELLFDLRFTDPWIAGDPYRTSYTANLFRRRSISLIFDGGDREVELDNGDRPRVVRLGGGVNFTRPLSRNVFEDAEWTASAGLQYQRVSIRDNDGDIAREDERGNQLSFSGDGKDDLITLQLGAVRDRRNNPTETTSGSLLRLGVEQSVPIGLGSILFNRLRGSYSRYFPVNITRFTDGPETLAFNLQAGTVVGDLPPYEAFSLGGSNSVRGYDEGDVGSGRSFVQASAEYRFPLFSIVRGALFVDVASDLGSGRSVPGDPAGARRKPGTGAGFGVGVRVRSPLGPIRIDYGFNDQGDSQLHFGIGERF